MEPARQKLLARLLLLAFAAACGLRLARLDYGRKISTNVLDLIPAGERSPELALVRELAANRQSRVLLCALQPAAGAADAELARRFAAELKKSPAIADAVAMDDPAARDALGRYVFERRFALLLPGWLAQERRAFAAAGRPAEKFPPWLAGRVVQNLTRFLGQPEALAFQDLVPADPLLLMPGLAEKLQLIAAPGAGADGRALVWAEIRDSPFTAAGQQPVFAAVARALAAVQARAPGTELAWTGVSRFAAAGQARTKAEISLLNTLSLLAVLAIAVVFIRRAFKVLHLIPVILLATLGAWTACTLAFDRVHILVFVLGSLLTGVAIDYGFYLYMQPPLRPGEPYGEKVRRILKPLLASCLTTVLGFSLLLFSDLPLIRELGVFVGAGLLCALGAALLYFAQLDNAFLETRAFALPRPASPAGARRWRGGLRGLLFAALAVAATGPWLLRWNDDIRELEAPARALTANDARVRAWFGDRADRTVYLTRGATPAGARAALGRFLAWHAREFPGRPAASLGLLLPTADKWRELPRAADGLRGFAGDLRAALDQGGYDAAEFAPFFTAWNAFLARPQPEAYDALFTGLQAHLDGPLGLLFSTGKNLSWFMTVAGHPAGAPPPAATATAGIDQLQTLNRLFARYRWSALRLSLIGLGLLAASVFLIYGWRRGVRIALIPAGSCFFAFGVLGLCGQTLNLFHLLGAFLGVCLAHNYAIFSAEAAWTRTAPPPSIRLSALTTSASFGVLGFSAIPVVSSLGLMVALIVLTALAAVELETWFHQLGPPAHAKAREN